MVGLEAGGGKADRSTVASSYISSISFAWQNIRCLMIIFFFFFTFCDELMII